MLAGHDVIADRRRSKCIVQTDFERAIATLYGRLIVTIRLSCTVSENNQVSPLAGNDVTKQILWKATLPQSRKPIDNHRLCKLAITSDITGEPRFEV